MSGGTETIRDRYVYALFREDGVTPFYIGKGKGNRLIAHERHTATLNRNLRKSHIIRKMLLAGMEVPKRKLASGLTNLEACELEQLLISEIRRIDDGGPLVNLTAGGEGIVDPAPETRRKISIALTRKPRKPQGAEANARRSASLRISWQSLSPDQRLRRGMYGKTHSAATRLKMSLSAAGRKPSALAIARTIDTRTGRPLSPETRRRMSEAHTRRSARDRANG